jgi:protein-S-isoprenylcysteine O-methyltransferase Ste14
VAAGLLAPVVLGASGFVCFAAFVWGVKSHFRRTGRIPNGTKLISVLSLSGFIAFSLHLALGRPNGVWQFALFLFVLSLGLFSWTVLTTKKNPPTLAFDDDKPAFLLSSGPYRYVRHPFYLSYILFWTGTATAFSGLLPWLVPAVMLAVYRQAASREEKKFAQSEFASAYERYRERAGMFFPKLGAV